MDDGELAFVCQHVVRSKRPTVHTDLVSAFYSDGDGG
jgi:hypothetical protein